METGVRANALTLTSLRALTMRFTITGTGDLSPARDLGERRFLATFHRIGKVTGGESHLAGLDASIFRTAPRKS